MNLGKKKDDVGDDDNNNHHESGARIMSNVRRGSSATVSDRLPRDQIEIIEIKNEEATNLLEHEEIDSMHLYRLGTTQGAKRRDCGKWLRPVSLLLGILVVTIVAFASSNTLLRASHIHLDIFNLFRLGSDGETSHTTGIQLHPTNHVFRRPKTITHNWIITKGFRSPDGVRKEVYLVNGEFPGPTIQSRSGDNLIIHVINQLPDEGVSIHWHGLQMRNANAMDGAAGVTQCPIPAGNEFRYDFHIDEEQSGTFWWHAHSQTQRGDGMYGGFIVHKPAGSQSELEFYDYKKEVLLLVGDWYHRSGAEVLDWYTSVRGFGNEVWQAHKVVRLS